MSSSHYAIISSHMSWVCSCLASLGNSFWILLFMIYICGSHIFFISVDHETPGSNPRDISPGILLLLFQYTDNVSFHCQVVDTLLSLKCDLFNDLLSVIAHGTPQTRIPAANLLFHYWPSLNLNIYDRRAGHSKFSGEALCLFISWVLVEITHAYDFFIFRV